LNLNVNEEDVDKIVKDAKGEKKDEDKKDNDKK
jgi:hypothetical protein